MDDIMRIYLFDNSRDKTSINFISFQHVTIDFMNP